MHRRTFPPPSYQSDPRFRYKKIGVDEDDDPRRKKRRSDPFGPSPIQQLFGWVYCLGCGFLVLALLVIALWIWWLIWYIEERPDCCDDGEPYLPGDALCNDTGQYVDFSCFNETLCEAMTEQNTSLGCLGDVNITDPGPGDIVIWNNETMMWENEQCDPCTNGTDGEDGICTEPCEDGTDGEDGLNCWDIDGNGLCDLQIEDVNDDGVCNQTDCIGGPGQDGLNGTSATIDECEKPFGQLRYANGTGPADHVPFVLNFTTPNTWTTTGDLLCDTSMDHFINTTDQGCFFTTLTNDSYKVELDVSFKTTMPPGTEIWIGISINGADPDFFNSFSVDSTDQDTLSFTVAIDLAAYDQVSFQFYGTNTTGSLDIDRIQFTIVGELLCGFDVTGPKGDTGNTGPKGDDGYHCWDLNENYFCDLGTEDINNDGYCTVADCTLANITYDNITGDICPVLDDASIDCLGDVNTTSPTDGQILVYESGSWVNQDHVSMDFDCNDTAGPCDCGTVDCPPGTTWFDPEDGVQYYCDCASGNRWLSVGPALTLYGENDEQCATYDVVSFSRACAAQFGAGLGSNIQLGLGNTMSFYLDYPITIVASSISSYGLNCFGAGGPGVNIKAEICWADSGTDDVFTQGNCSYTGPEINPQDVEDNEHDEVTGTRIDIPGGVYILWGLDANNCGVPIDKRDNVKGWNMVVYYKQHYVV